MEFNLLRTAYQISATAPHNFPPDEGFEVAFAGRSNAGKSSCLNTITNQKPWRGFQNTWPNANDQFFCATRSSLKLVDLPGYGFAKVPGACAQTGVRTFRLFRDTPALKGLVVMMDVRRPFGELDQQMINWAVSVASRACGAHQSG